MNVSPSSPVVDLNSDALLRTDAAGERPADTAEQADGDKRPDGPKGWAWGRRAKEAGAGPGGVAEAVRRLKADTFERSSEEIPEGASDTSAPEEAEAVPDAGVVGDTEAAADADPAADVAASVDVEVGPEVQVADGATPEAGAPAEGVVPISEVITESVEPVTKLGFYEFLGEAAEDAVQFDLVV